MLYTTAGKYKIKVQIRLQNQMQVKNANTKKAIETLDQETYRECQMRGRTYKQDTNNYGETEAVVR